MSSDKAIEGHWYSHRNEGAFFVIAVDEGDAVIDVRDEYGDVDEFDFEEWEAMDLQLCAASEGWLSVTEDEDELAADTVVEDLHGDLHAVAHAEPRIAAAVSGKH